MAPCRECGTELPETARFCSNCGTPVHPAEVGPPPQTTPEPAGSPAELDFLQPALAGGFFLGVLSSLPFISAGNCLCCMWILGGGGLAAYMLHLQRPGGVTYGDGAFGGVLSGLAGAVVATVMSIPVRLLSGRLLESQQEALEEAFAEMPGFDGPFRDLLLRMASPEVSPTIITFTFLMNLILFALFAMIGGILMVAILRKKESPSVA